MGLVTTPRGYRTPDGAETAALDLITGRLAGDIDADVSRVEGRGRPLKLHVLSTNSGAINPSTTINIGKATFPTGRVRITMSGIVASSVASTLFAVLLRDGAPDGAQIADLRARPMLAGAAGEVTWTSRQYRDVTIGERTLYLTAVRTDGTGTGVLNAGFTVEIEAVNV